MPHADSSLVPLEITSKAEFGPTSMTSYSTCWQTKDIGCGIPATCVVTNLANASSLIYNALLAFKPHFGDGGRAVNWCGEPHFVRYGRTSLAAGRDRVSIPPHSTGISVDARRK
ncbi:hypothetical protein J3R83DRAFT_7668 [Lanmaoa asiatica]|nr:hypothetical protein J3R83DRAFT_7668 [Lanmaoa asiatica]